MRRLARALIADILDFYTAYPTRIRYSRAIGFKEVPLHLDVRLSAHTRATSAVCGGSNFASHAVPHATGESDHPVRLRFRREPADICKFRSIEPVLSLILILNAHRNSEYRPCQPTLC